MELSSQLANATDLFLSILSEQERELIKQSSQELITLDRLKGFLENNKEYFLEKSGYNEEEINFFLGLDYETIVHKIVFPLFLKKKIILIPNDSPSKTKIISFHRYLGWLILNHGSIKDEKAPSSFEDLLNYHVNPSFAFIKYELETKLIPPREFSLDEIKDEILALIKLRSCPQTENILLKRYIDTNKLERALRIVFNSIKNLYGENVFLSRFQKTAIIQSLFSRIINEYSCQRCNNNECILSGIHLSKKHLVITAPVGSGKTWAYIIGGLVYLVYERISDNIKPSKILVIVPRRDLAYDLYNKGIGRLVHEINKKIGLKIEMDAWGSLHSQPINQRYEADIILTNPDSLKNRLHNPSLSKYWRINQFSYIIIDEIHLFTDLIGGNTSLLLYRLLSLSIFNELNNNRQKITNRDLPVFIGASATIKNASSHFKKLLGLEKIKNLLNKLNENNKITIHKNDLRKFSLIQEINAEEFATSRLGRVHHILIRIQRKKHIDASVANLLYLLVHNIPDKATEKLMEIYYNGQNNETIDPKEISKTLVFMDTKPGLQMAAHIFSQLEKRRITINNDHFINRYVGYVKAQDLVLMPDIFLDKTLYSQGKCRVCKNEEHLPYEEWAKIILDPNNMLLENCPVFQNKKCWYFGNVYLPWVHTDYLAAPHWDHRRAPPDSVHYFIRDRELAEEQALRIFSNQDTLDSLFLDKENKVIKRVGFVTPVFEVGVSLHNVKNILMAKALRSISSYKQKVGRGGREAGEDLIATTIITDRPKDKQVLRTPEIISSNHYLEPISLNPDNYFLLKSHFIFAIIDYIINSGNLTSKLELHPENLIQPQKFVYILQDQNLRTKLFLALINELKSKGLIEYLELLFGSVFLKETGETLIAELIESFQELVSLEEKHNIINLLKNEGLGNIFVPPSNKASLYRFKEIIQKYSSLSTKIKSINETVNSQFEKHKLDYSVVDGIAEEDFIKETKSEILSKLISQAHSLNEHDISPLINDILSILKKIWFLIENKKVEDNYTFLDVFFELKEIIESVKNNQYDKSLIELIVHIKEWLYEENPSLSSLFITLLKRNGHLIPDNYFSYPSNKRLLLNIKQDDSTMLKYEEHRHDELFRYFPGAYRSFVINEKYVLGKIEPTSIEIKWINSRPLKQYLYRLEDLSYKSYSLEYTNNDSDNNTNGAFIVVPKELEIILFDENFLGIEGETRSKNLRACPVCRYVWDNFETKAVFLDSNTLPICKNCYDRGENRDPRWITLFELNNPPQVYPILKVNIKENSPKVKTKFSFLRDHVELEMSNDATIEFLIIGLRRVLPLAIIPNEELNNLYYVYWWARNRMNQYVDEIHYQVISKKDGEEKKSDLYFKSEIENAPFFEVSLRLPSNTIHSFSFPSRTYFMFLYYIVEKEFSHPFLKREFLSFISDYSILKDDFPNNLESLKVFISTLYSEISELIKHIQNNSNQDEEISYLAELINKAIMNELPNDYESLAPLLISLGLNEWDSKRSIFQLPVGYFKKDRVNVLKIIKYVLNKIKEKEFEKFLSDIISHTIGHGWFLASSVVSNAGDNDLGYLYSSFITKENIELKTKIYETISGGIGLIDTSLENFDYSPSSDKNTTSVISEFERFTFSCDFSVASKVLYNYSKSRSFNELLNKEQNEIKKEIRLSIFSYDTHGKEIDSLFGSIFPYIDMLIAQNSHITFSIISKVFNVSYDMLPILSWGSKAASYKLIKQSDIGDKKAFEQIQKIIFHLDKIEELKDAESIKQLISKIQVAFEDSIYSCVNGCTECIILPSQNCTHNIEQEIKVDRGLVEYLFLNRKNANIVELSPDLSIPILDALFEKHNAILLKISTLEYVKWGHNKLNDIKTYLRQRNNVQHEEKVIIDPTGFLLTVEEDKFIPIMYIRLRKLKNNVG